MNPYKPLQGLKFIYDFDKNEVYIQSSVNVLMGEGESLHDPPGPEIDFAGTEVHITWRINLNTLDDPDKILYFVDFDDFVFRIFDRKTLDNNGNIISGYLQAFGIAHISELSSVVFKVHCYVVDGSGELLGKSTNLLKPDDEIVDFVTASDPEK